MNYSISSEYSRDGAFWIIRDIGNTQNDLSDYPGKIVWRRPIREGEDGMGEYPADLRATYETLMGQPEFSQEGAQPINIVELIAQDVSGFNQQCRFGYLVDGHAVYCHNTGWLYAPRKCRRTWDTGGEVRDEDCKGYQPNEARG